ncbi:MAG: imidazolonepropionase [Planctomycetota bacterium]|jgi:imidazolonepropionase
MSKIAADLLVLGAKELVTPLGTKPIGGEALARPLIVEDAGVACAAGKIVAVGTSDDLRTRYSAAKIVDARGGVIVPGFVDAHTHPVFMGTREAEFEQRAAGATYLEIAQAGGGILSTVRGVREASEESLEAALMLRLDRFLAMGTTTIEAKSGYGLTVEDELKSLRVIAKAASRHAVDLVPTFLGAHSYPPEAAHDKASYVDLIIDEMLPRVVEQKLAVFCDIFTEAHVFDVPTSRRILTRARDLGLGLRLHVDQLTSLGGAELAAELGAQSADHLEHISEAGIAALGEAGVVPVLCPVVPLFLREGDHEAPARRMLDRGLTPALSTDFNPGSCFMQSMPEVLSWAALRYGMSAAETLGAATLNAACSLGLGAEVGSLEVGKRADLLVLDVPNYRHLTYELGRNPVGAVVKAGRLVHEVARA